MRLRYDRRELAAIFAGRFVGAIARAEVVEALPRDAGEWPWATLLVNLVGTALLGYFVVRLRERLPLSAYPRPFLGTRVCGALTTFSTMQLEIVRMLDGPHVGLAVAYATVSICAGFVTMTIATSLTRRVRLAA